MDKYISRKDALSAQNKSMNLNEMRKRLERLPAADVRPVVKAIWKHVQWVVDEEWQEGGYWISRCSNCSMPYHTETPFCPHCGADMRGRKLMYDELVKTLRDMSKMGMKYGIAVVKMQEAADAIEELSKQLLEMGQVGKFLLDVHKINSKMVAPESIPTDSEWWSRYKALLEVLYLPRWIPVTERLPVGGDDSGAGCENVCLMMDDGTVSCGWMNGITKKVYYLNARDDVVIKAPITRVTHWMPLPQPPKEE